MARSCATCCLLPQPYSLLAERVGPTEEEDEEACKLNPDNPSVIQFSAPLYLCTEEKPHLVVNVIRLGDASGDASVWFQTISRSAKAGVKFEEVNERIAFAPGETAKDVSVELIQDSRWDATLEFELQLSKVRGASLGMYLHTSRARIIDDDKYPTNKYEETLTGASLMVEYVKAMMLDPVVWGASFKHLSLDLIKGLYFFLTLYLQVYLIDVVLAKPEEGEGEEEGKGEGERILVSVVNGTARVVARMLHEEEGEEGEELSFVPHALLIPGNRRATASLVAALYVVPFVLVHMVDVLRVRLEIPYALHKHTRSSLLDKFMNYKESIRSNMNVGEMTMVMMRDTLEVCDFGYMKLLSVGGILIKLSFALVFIMAENRLVLLPLVSYPVVLGLFLLCRERLTIEVNEDRAKKEDDVAQAVSETVANYRLIADFNLRRRAVDAYEKTMSSLHHAERAAKTVVMNNMYMAPWMTTMFVGMWIFYGSNQIESLGGKVTLGAFIATINIFKEIGLELCEVYAELMEVQRSFGPLEKICCYMNKETDLFDRMRMLEQRQELGHRLRQEARQCVQDGVASPSRTTSGLSRGLSRHSISAMSHPAFVVDTLDIFIESLSFSYGNNVVLQNLSMEFPQGRMYAFLGPSHQGKATLMKLLAGVHLPRDGGGVVFFPPHLRVLHISLSECLINDTLVENVLLYASDSMDRVHSICKRVGFKPAILRHLGLGDLRANWVAKFSHTDYVRLNLARALVVNPEVLVIHKPECVFSAGEVSGIMKLLRAHVDERGLELPEEGRPYRRPRTVFFTTTTAEGVNMADHVYKVQRKPSATPIAGVSIKVRVEGAEHLKNTDREFTEGLSDPYVVSEVVGKSDASGRTRTVRDSLNPKWGEILDFGNVTADDVLQFWVRDKDLHHADEDIGGAKVKVKDLIVDGQESMHVPMVLNLDEPAQGSDSSAMRPCTSSGGTRSTLKVEFLIEPPCSEHLDPAEIIEIERPE